MWTAWTPSSRSRRWKRRKKSNAVARAWTWVIGIGLVVAAAGAMVWEVTDQIEFQRSRRTTMKAAAIDVIRGTDFTPWQLEVLDALEKGVADVGQGNLSQAESLTDKATALLTTARLKSENAEPDFFQLTVSGLDRIWSQQPDNDSLFRHVTAARIELAALRVAQNVTDAAHSPESSSPKLVQAAPADANVAIPAVGGLRSPAGRPEARGGGRSVSITIPRAMAANYTLSPETLGEADLDATRMPAAAKILLPPARRSFEDNVRVENVRIRGGSQSIDGIRWSNVTFIGTRLRYARGPIDLENVRFVGCTFDFSTDERGARLANAIALGQTSFTGE